jgi:hypothetical protein
MAAGIPNLAPEAGQRFGRLIVVSLTRLETDGRAAVVARCDCGRSVTVRTANLLRGLSQSCGCLMRQRTSEAARTHGRSRTPEHSVWTSIKGRCFNLNNHAYSDYGGRGIAVCAEWRTSFETFYRDMGPRPDGATLDRKDNDGPYSKSNCRWATRKTQANNRRSNHVIEFHGESLTLSGWAERTGIPYDVVKQRINKLRWTVERALTTPTGRRAA